MPAVTVLGLSITRETEDSDVQTRGRNLISSKLGQECVPIKLSRDILFPTILRSLTVHQSDVAYPGYTTILQLDCTPSALVAREARDPPKIIIILIKRYSLTRVKLSHCAVQNDLTRLQIVKPCHNGNS